MTDVSSRVKLCFIAFVLVTLLLLTGCATAEHLDCSKISFIQTADNPALFDLVVRRDVVAHGLTVSQIREMCSGDHP